MEHWSFMQGGCPASPESVAKKKAAVECLQWLLSLLRAQYWTYQNAHWVAGGENAYGTHLLFQRIYAGDDDNEGEDDDGIQGEVDALAEKMVAAFGEESVDPKTLLKMSEKWICRWCVVKDCLHKRALLSEQDFQKLAKWVYDKLKALGELSLGMDDFLMSLASEHETNEYLLRQVLRSKESARMAADDWAALTKE